MLAMLASLIAARAGFVPGCDGWTWTRPDRRRPRLDSLRSPKGAEVLRYAASFGGDRAAWGAVANAAILLGRVDPASNPPDGPWLLAAARSEPRGALAAGSKGSEEPQALPCASGEAGPGRVRRRCS